MARKDIHKDGIKTRFSSTNQPENSGRRPNVFAKYVRENRVSLDDIKALISSLMSYNADEIQAILKDEKTKPPIAIILMLKAIMKDMERGEIDNFEKLSDRVFGKPEKIIDKVEISGNIGVDTTEVLKKLSDRELLDVINEQRPKR